MSDFERFIIDLTEKLDQMEQSFLAQDREILSFRCSFEGVTGGNQQRRQKQDPSPQRLKGQLVFHPKFLSGLERLSRREW